MTQATGLLEWLAKMSPTDREEVLASLRPEVIEAARAVLCIDDFAMFVRAAWHLVEPTSLVWSWHLEAFCVHLEAVTRGTIKRLIINVPPRHSKSLIVSVLWPAWIWAHRPEWRSLFASYSAELATDHSVTCRALIESTWYRTRFMTGWTIRRDQNAKHNFKTSVGGERYATSVGGGGTGKGGDAVVIDDPISAQESFSKAARDEVIRWYGQTITTRLNDARTGRILVIMQRFHEDDLSGYLMRAGGFQCVVVPSEFERDRRAITFHTVGGVTKEFWRDPRTKEGELLCPERFPRDVLDALKIPSSGLGPDGYAGQHQQRPTPATGGMFQRGWWRFWKPDGTGDEKPTRPTHCFDGPARVRPKDFDAIIITVDANFKAKAGADPVSALVLGAKGPDRYLLERQSGPWGFTRTCEVLTDMHNRWEPQGLRKTIVELAANGDAIVETLQATLSGVVGVRAEGGKEARAWAVQPEVQAGNIHLPDGAEWLDEWVSQFGAFPRGRHDDDVDALSQGLNDLRSIESTASKWLRQIEEDGE